MLPPERNPAHVLLLTTLCLVQDAAHGETSVNLVIIPNIVPSNNINCQCIKYNGTSASTPASMPPSHYSLPLQLYKYNEALPHQLFPLLHNPYVLY